MTPAPTCKSVWLRPAGIAAAAVVLAVLALPGLHGPGSPVAFAQKMGGPITAPELDGGTAWLNTDKPVKLKDLRGKIVLLDFWTFCCINCIHIMPDLAKLEQKYPNELV